MKKSFEVNLGGRIFNFDEDAYELLNSYIENLKVCFAAQDGGDEIIADIEVRLSELCETRMREGSARIVDFSMIDEFITRMGRPESLAQESTEEQDSTQETSADAQHKREPWRDAMLLGKKLFRDTRNGLLGGVFSGLAVYTGLNMWLLRIVAILIFIFVGGIIVPLVYLVAWLTLPMAVSVTDLMRMRDVKAAPGERVEETWAREYERCSAEIMNGGIARDNKGCLSWFIIVLLLLILLPIIFMLAFIGYLGNTVFGELPSFFDSMGGNNFIELSLVLGEIVYPFLIFIPIFLIGHYLLRKKNKVRPLKKWLKIFLIALWVILLGIFLSSDNKSVKLPFFKYEKRIYNNSPSTKKETVVETPIEHIKELLAEFEKIAASPEATTLKNYFLSTDKYADCDKYTRVLWHCITSASSDSLIPFAVECTKLNDKAIWTIMPRDEWMEYVKTPASVSKIEIVGGLDSGSNSLSDICCVIDTVAKKVFVDLSNCTGADDLRISVNSIPGWSVEYIEQVAMQPAQPNRVEFLMRVYADRTLPSLLVREVTPDGSVKAKAIPQTVYKERERVTE